MSGGDAAIWIVVLGFVAVVALIVVLVYWRRSSKLQAFAKKNGLTFHKSSPVAALVYSDLSGAWNVLETNVNGTETTVFQSRIDTGKTGQNGEVKTVPVVVVSQELGHSVASLLCKPKKKMSFHSRAAEVVTGDPEFDRRFVCDAGDAGEAARILTPELTRLLVADPPVFFATGADAVCIGFKGNLNEKRYRPALDQALRVFDAADLNG